MKIIVEKKNRKLSTQPVLESNADMISAESAAGRTDRLDKRRILVAILAGCILAAACIVLARLGDDHGLYFVLDATQGRDSKPAELQNALAKSLNAGVILISG